MQKKNRAWVTLCHVRTLKKLMEKERDKELEHVERDGLFAHCKLCADCRAKQQEIRNTLLGEGGLG
jgi:hypothetical protein